MRIESEVRDFLEKHKDLFESEDFVTLYDRARRVANWFPKTLTETLVRANINPLTYMDIIPKNYLYGDETLNNFEIPAHIKSIENYAFGYCSNLKKISFSEGLIDIKNGAFYSAGLTEVSLPDSVQILGRRAFSECRSLSGVDIPDNVRDINDRAFAGCTNLTSMTLGTNLRYIDISVWYLCSKLTSLSYRGTIEQWNKILKDEFWNNGSSLQVIHCVDGDINL